MFGLTRMKTAVKSGAGSRNSSSRLAVNLGMERCKPRDIAARPGEACRPGPTRPHRSPTRSRSEWSTSLLSPPPRRRVPGVTITSTLEANELGKQRRQPGIVAVPPSDTRSMRSPPSTKAEVAASRCEMHRCAWQAHRPNRRAGNRHRDFADATAPVRRAATSHSPHATLRATRAASLDHLDQHGRAALAGYSMPMCLRRLEIYRSAQTWWAASLEGPRAWRLSRSCRCIQPRRVEFRHCLRRM